MEKKRFALWDMLEKSTEKYYEYLILVVSEFINSFRKHTQRPFCHYDQFCKIVHSKNTLIRLFV